MSFYLILIFKNCKISKGEIKSKKNENIRNINDEKQKMGEEEKKSLGKYSRTHSKVIRRSDASCMQRPHENNHRN